MRGGRVRIRIRLGTPRRHLHINKFEPWDGWADFDRFDEFT
jgi:hypothetical protein